MWLSEILIKSHKIIKIVDKIIKMIDKILKMIDGRIEGEG
jgi:hypothetical protein